jgi:hypothetical protein
MNHRRLMLPGVCLLSALLGACAIPTHAMLTYQSVPEGAEVFEGGKSLGTAPVTRTYVGAANAQKITTPDVTAVWPSGAKTTYFTLLEPNADRVATLARPANAPGLDQDLAFAQQLAAKRKLDAQREADFKKGQIDRASPLCRQEQGQGTLGVAQDCQ